MRKVIIIIALIQAVVFYDLVGQKKTGKYFNRYFEYVKKITLPNNMLVGDITSIDTFEDRIVMVDKLGKNVYLVTSNGKLIKTLNSDECNPGIKWLPYRAYFNKRGDIYVLINYPPWGFRFDKNGKCVGPVDRTFLGTFWYAFTLDNNIIGYNRTNKYKTNSLILMDEKGKEIKNFGVFPQEFKNLISTQMGGGLVADYEDNIYQLNVCSFEITVYNKKGELLKKINCRPNKYIPPQKDISKAVNPQQIRKDFASLGDFTNPERLYMLDKNVLAAEYWNMGTLELVLCDYEGIRLNKLPINYEKDKSLLAKDGLLYFAVQPDINKNGDIPNPYISVYRYKSYMKGK